MGGQTLRTVDGAELTERTLIPNDDAQLGEARFENWLSQPVPQK